jgi:hypothetical protein
MRRLEQLQAAPPAPETRAIHLVAQQAILDEISQVMRRDWLAVYRNGDSFSVVSLV